MDPAPPIGDAWSIHFCLALQMCFSVCPPLKCSADFIWIVVPCLNPELILTHFFVLRLDEPEHCRRANRHVDDPRACGRRVIFTHQRHISSEWRDEDTRQRLLEQNDAETVWQIQVKKTVRHPVGSPHLPHLFHSHNPQLTGSSDAKTPQLCAAGANRRMRRYFWPDPQESLQRCNGGIRNRLGSGLIYNHKECHPKRKIVCSLTAPAVTHLFQGKINCFSDTRKSRNLIMGPLCHVKHADCISRLW